jgi:hypothetical protein
MPAYRGPELDIHALYPTRKQLPLKVRRLLEFLGNALRVPQWSLAGPARGDRSPS